jgi:hypothetical protein
MKRRSLISLASVALVGLFVFAGLTTVANERWDGVSVCVDHKTRNVTAASGKKCPNGSTLKVMGIKQEAAPATQILSGQLPPSIEEGNVGDFFIDLRNANLFGPKTDEGWGNAVRLRGQDGYGGTGAQGPAGPAGPAGRDAAPIVNTLPSTFNQMFRIDQVGGFGCCEPANTNLVIYATYKNNTGGIVSFPSNDNAQVWLGFFDEDGNRLEVPNSNPVSRAFSPQSEVILFPSMGTQWAAGDEVEFKLTLTNLYHQKPANAVYVSVTFRLLNMTNYNNFFFDGDDFPLVDFSASPFVS